MSLAYGGIAIKRISIQSSETQGKCKCDSSSLVTYADISGMGTSKLDIPVRKSWVPNRDLPND